MTPVDMWGFVAGKVSLTSLMTPAWASDRFSLSWLGIGSCRSSTPVWIYPRHDACQLAVIAFLSSGVCRCKLPIPPCGGREASHLTSQGRTSSSVLNSGIQPTEREQLGTCERAMRLPSRKKATEAHQSWTRGSKKHRVANPR